LLWIYPLPAHRPGNLFCSNSDRLVGSGSLHRVAAAGFVAAAAVVVRDAHAVSDGYQWGGARCGTRRRFAGAESRVDGGRGAGDCVDGPSGAVSDVQRCLRTSNGEAVRENVGRDSDLAAAATTGDDP